MKVAIVNCFDTYEERVDMLRDWFTSNGCDVRVYSSAFSHFNKTFRTETKPGYTLVKSRPYYKNISLARMVSHHFFAKDAFARVEKFQPDLLYTLTPPNSLAQYAARWKAKHYGAELCLDIIDMWPETMPLGATKRCFPFTLWRGMRDNCINAADIVITECNMYREALGSLLDGKRGGTLYLAKKNQTDCAHIKTTATGELSLCYLGSINNIIDIDKISGLIKSAAKQKPVVLHIIGDGQARDSFISAAEASGARVIYHGKIFAPAEKQKIFALCSFGLNIMKESVCVGLTMKSIDYFEAGLPILNTIKGDTWRLVNECGIGFNMAAESIEAAARFAASSEQGKIDAMHKATRGLFDKHFSEEAFDSKMGEMFGEDVKRQW